jgi:hypothetical protein
LIESYRQYAENPNNSGKADTVPTNTRRPPPRAAAISMEFAGYLSMAVDLEEPPFVVPIEIRHPEICESLLAVIPMPADRLADWPAAAQPGFGSPYVSLY